MTEKEMTEGIKHMRQTLERMLTIMEKNDYVNKYDTLYNPPKITQRTIDVPYPEITIFCP